MPTALPVRQLPTTQPENPLVYIVAALVFLMLVCSTAKLQPPVAPDGNPAQADSI